MTAQRTSRIAVLIPHYDSTHDLCRSLASIPGGEPVDVVIVDDGSAEPPTREQVEGAAAGAAAVELLLLPENAGIEHALNHGLEFIRAAGYEFVARLDAGDECLDERFRIQREFLDERPEVALVGANVVLVDREGRELGIRRYPTSAKRIRRVIHVRNPHAHPTVMFRTRALDAVGLYPTAYPYNEDHAYWFEFARHFETANIDRELVRYEINVEGITQSRSRQRLRNGLRLLLHRFSWRHPLYGVAGLVRKAIVLSFGSARLNRIALGRGGS
jgi:glycosyltransferase involved in cell wall biosynthesis